MNLLKNEQVQPDQKCPCWVTDKNVRNRQREQQIAGANLVDVRNIIYILIRPTPTFSGRGRGLPSPQNQAPLGHPYPRAPGD